MALILRRVGHEDVTVVETSGNETIVLRHEEGDHVVYLTEPSTAPGPTRRREEAKAAKEAAPAAIRVRHPRRPTPKATSEPAKLKAQTKARKKATSDDEKSQEKKAVQNAISDNPPKAAKAAKKGK